MAQMGRPRRFDRDEAVQQALHLFWQHGYESTSLAQLKAHIGGGITAPSFYAAFGSKEALFREAVACYLNSHGRVNDALWDESLPPRQAIEISLRRSVKMQCEADHPKGCMVALGVMAGGAEHDAAVLQPLADSRQRTLNGFIFCVERGIATGELAASVQPAALATVFDSFLLGVSTLARDGVSHQVLDDAVTRLLSIWDTHRPNG
ncbi:TetR/AcrR family transcriptional regulator [Serratia entomophila]|jgi:AcrR family transcriptional regulator|uniref:TetR/AcrR family transcriptional regulator n=1 Tax=Serratia entomophila TaxID=42906 RepID=A0ABY5CZM1_9GAMM|nr:TetR/AcrR family transcriptional regulator [Serratia entomophila]USV03120.1 TetR/AcrR family transcriptional regulator [Serratia entomophila]CAI0806763.1 Bacterial regulatory proteins, tetR family [Serratia entomophila]CAI0808459.1 Bacterial regulatory proteins, tetR family [Serratia entomophila]CAI0817754.1 Bacterial regulatory proteins, tetR family [Serratia entomophila]CAI0842506.1 Bacterial regulatory proteins, tetR family [Serratia entomophila]